MNRMCDENLRRDLFEGLAMTMPQSMFMDFNFQSDYVPAYKK